MESKNKRDKMLKTTREEAKRNILKKVKEDKIGRHRQIIHLLSLCSIIEQIYDAHEAELKAKDERIEAQSSVIIACQNAILQKDERITELEAKAIRKEQAKAENFVNIDVSDAALGSASTLKNILQKLGDNK